MEKVDKIKKFLDGLLWSLVVLTIIVNTIILLSSNSTKAIDYEEVENIKVYKITSLPAKVENKSKLEFTELEETTNLNNIVETSNLINVKVIGSSNLENYEEYKVENDIRKSYMDYTKITLKSSKQYELQQSAYTNPNGLRVVDERYCVAVGSYYTTSVGTKLDVILENGTIIPCILGDLKKDCDTKNNHKLGTDGGAVEFIVETGKLNHDSTYHGDVSYSTENWLSNVDYIRVYEDN